MGVDPSEHLNLVRRVIRQMGLQGDDAEEAFSESLLTITEAAQKYDPSRSVPLANWLARNVRWGIINWMRRTRTWYPIPDAQPARDTFENSEYVNELLELLRKLTPREQYVLVASAAGYTGKEIAKRMGISATKVSEIKYEAKVKLGQRNNG